MIIVPPGSMSLTESLPDLLNRIKPVVGSDVHVREVGPGSVAVTVTPLGVPAPAGIAIDLEAIFCAVSDVFSTVKVYPTDVPTRAVVGVIIAEKYPLFLTLIVRVTLESLLPALSKAAAYQRSSPSPSVEV